jgi:hypothetical protein
MLQAPAEHIFHGVAHLIPGSVEGLGGFLPGEFARPASQKQHMGSAQLVLPIAPGNLLDHYATIPAVNAPRAVQQKNQKAPQRDELEAALGKMIVTRCRLVAPEQTAFEPLRGRTSTSMLFLIGCKAGMLVDEFPMAMAVV